MKATPALKLTFLNIGIAFGAAIAYTRGYRGERLLLATGIAAVFLNAAGLLGIFLGMRQKPDPMPRGTSTFVLWAAIALVWFFLLLGYLSPAKR
jgi:hypothetical protein